MRAVQARTLFCRRVGPACPTVLLLQLSTTDDTQAMSKRKNFLKLQTLDVVVIASRWATNSSRVRPAFVRSRLICRVSRQGWNCIARCGPLPLHSTPLTGRAIKPQRQGHTGGPLRNPEGGEVDRYACSVGRERGGEERALYCTWYGAKFLLWFQFLL